MTNTHRELPPVNMGHSVDEFFEHIEKGSKEGKTLPNWCGSCLCTLLRVANIWCRKGELYLEVRTERSFFFS